MITQENEALMNASADGKVIAPPKAKPAGRQTWVLALCALVAMIVLSGCSTMCDRSNAGSLPYNQLTGYPAVGRFDETGW